ncbi:MAA2-related membrane protein [Metamycoplasma arthritidis]|uniref:hypothetical protein n=1 Tax=Metamycoplasma arthritidis TaxID=2111 RepID=UPI0010051A34|nr:hypothetical protein [Metamycoplasma arthritidis]VEU78896.1 MAA2-related membrane protein [Metamycoplasma arthritidis]
MRRKKITLITSVLATTSLPLLAAACQDPKKEFNDVFNKLTLNVKNKNDLTVDQVNEKNIDISNFDKNKYEIKINSLEKKETSIEVSLTITKKETGESASFKTTINGFKAKDGSKPKPNNGGQSDKPGERKPLDQDKHEQLLNVLGLDKTKTISENKNKFASIKSDNFELTKVAIQNYDDSKGVGLILVKGKYENKEFAETEVELNGFAKVLSENYDSVNIELRKDLMITNNKKIEDLTALEPNELVKYLKITLIKSGVATEFIPSSNYEMKLLTLNKSGNSYQANMTLAAKIKIFKNGNEQIEEKQLISQARIAIRNTEISNEDILNSFLAKIKQKSIEQDRYASSYIADFNKNIPFIHHLLELEDKYEKHFGSDKPIKMSVINASANDIQGKIYLSYKLESEDEVNNKTYSSKPVTTVIEGFAKVNESELKKIGVGHKTEKWKSDNLKQELKELFTQNGQNTNFEITKDRFWFK